MWSFGLCLPQGPKRRTWKTQTLQPVVSQCIQMADDIATRSLLIAVDGWYQNRNYDDGRRPYFDKDAKQFKLPCKHCGEGIVIQCSYNNQSVKVVQSGLIRHEQKHMKAKDNMDMDMDEVDDETAGSWKSCLRDISCSCV